MQGLFRSVAASYLLAQGAPSILGTLASISSYSGLLEESHPSNMTFLRQNVLQALSNHELSEYSRIFQIAGEYIRVRTAY